MSVVAKNIIDDENLNTLLEAIFYVVEQNYIRRTVHEEELSALNERVDILEALIDYKFEVPQSSGNLTLTVAETVDVDLAINNSGNLILTKDEDESSPLENFSFSQTSLGNLELTVSGSSE